MLNFELVREIFMFDQKLKIMNFNFLYLIVLAVIFINCTSGWIMNSKPENRKYYFGVGFSNTSDEDYIKQAADLAKKKLFKNILELNYTNVSTFERKISEIIQNELGYDDLIETVKSKHNDDEFYILVKMDKQKFIKQVKNRYHKLINNGSYLSNGSSNLINQINLLAAGGETIILYDLMHNTNENIQLMYEKLNAEANSIIRSIIIKNGESSILNRHKVVKMPGESYPLKFRLQSSKLNILAEIPIKIKFLNNNINFFTKTKTDGSFEYNISKLRDLSNTAGFIEIDFKNANPNINILFTDMSNPLYNFNLKTRYPNFYTAYDYNLKDGYKFEGFFNKSREVNPLKQTIEEYLKQKIDLNYTQHSQAEIILNVDFKVNLDKPKKLKSNDFYVAHGILNLKLSNKVSGKLIYFNTNDAIIGKSLKNIETAKQHCVIKTQDVLVNEILPEIVELFE